MRVTYGATIGTLGASIRSSEESARDMQASEGLQITVRVRADAARLHACYSGSGSIYLTMDCINERRTERRQDRTQLQRINKTIIDPSLIPILGTLCARNREAVRPFSGCCCAVSRLVTGGSFVAHSMNKC